MHSINFMMFTDNDCLNIKRQIIKKISIISKFFRFLIYKCFRSRSNKSSTLNDFELNDSFNKKNGSILFEFLERY